MKKMSLLSFIRKSFLLSFLACIVIPLDANCMKRGVDEDSNKAIEETAQAPARKRGKKASASVSTRDEAISTSTSASSSSSSSTVSSPLLPLIREHRFARATLDTSFRHMLMGDEDRTPLLSFLTAFTGINVTSVSHYSSALPILRKDPDEKQTFLDLACHDDKGRYFLVEVQVKEQDYWNPRALYYASGVYSQQLGPGAPWKALEPVIALNILDHDRKTLPDGHFKRDFQLLDRDHLGDLQVGIDPKDPSQLTYLRLIQCELPRANLATMPNCLLKQWLQLLKESGNLDEIPEGIEEPVRKAYKRLEFKEWGQELKRDYVSDQLELENYQGVLARSKEEGQLEASRNSALRMLAKNFTVEEIMDITGLSKDDVEALRSTNMDK